MSLRAFETNSFKRDIRRIKRTHDLAKLAKLIKLLESQTPLEQRYRDHAMVGNWKGYRDCHILPDWLLIYRIEGDVLRLVRTGSHSDLF